jgi:hypothetical protein
MNNKQKLLKALLPFIFLAAITSNAFSQRGAVHRYAQWRSFTGFTSIYGAGDGTTVSGDDSVGSFQLPFAFNFDSVTYSGTVYTSTNGWLSFTRGANVVGNFGGDTTAGRAIFVWCDDAWTYHDITYKTTGSSPNRTLTIEWPFISLSLDQGDFTAMQVKLHETSNAIELLYGGNHSARSEPSDSDGNPAGLDASVGLQGYPASNYNLFYSSSQWVPGIDLLYLPPGAPIPPAELSLEAGWRTPKSIDCGTANIGDVVGGFFVTASNVGCVPLHIRNVTLSGDPDFHIYAGPPPGDSILSGISESYGLYFKPTVGGARHATFTVQTSGQDSGTQSVSLSGICLVPTVSYGDTALFQHVHTRLGTTVVQYVHVSSTGTAPVTFGWDDYYGSGYYYPPFQFFGTDMSDYSASIPLSWDYRLIRQSDSIAVQFTPTTEGAAGHVKQANRLIINTNADNLHSYNIPLGGVGVLPRLAIVVPPSGIGNTLNFDSVGIGDSACQSVQLFNPGSDTLCISNQLLTYGDSDFAFYPLKGSDTIILPGASKPVIVCFKPTRSGTGRASVSISTNIPRTFETTPRDTSHFLVNLAGIGAPWGWLQITGPRVDTARVGKTACITLTATNVGLADLTVAGTMMSPASGQFTQTSGAPFKLGIGQSHQISVCFTAESPSPVLDSLVINTVTSEHHFTRSVPIWGYGTGTCASVRPMTLTFGTSGMTTVGNRDIATVTIHNCGDYLTTYTAAITSGKAVYSLPVMKSDPVPGQDSATLTIAFSPTAVGTTSGNLEITGGKYPVKIPLHGTGAGVVAAASGSVGAVAIGGCQDFDITLVNKGNVPWTPGNGSVTPPDFTIKSQPNPATIPPGGTATLTIHFCPTINGPEIMVLTFPSESPVPAAGAFRYITTGTGTTAEGVTIRTEQDGFSLAQSYPNPTNGLADVMFTLPNDAVVQIDLSDVVGTLVRSVFVGRMTAGDHTVRLNASGLASGTYFYSLTSGEVRLTRQLVLQK